MEEWIEEMGDMTLSSMHGTVSDEKKEEQSSSSFDRWGESEGGREGVNLFFCSSTPVPAYFLSFYAMRKTAAFHLPGN